MKPKIRIISKSNKGTLTSKDEEKMKKLRDSHLGIKKTPNVKSKKVSLEEKTKTDKEDNDNMDLSFKDSPDVFEETSSSDDVKSDPENETVNKVSAASQVPAETSSLIPIAPAPVTFNPEDFMEKMMGKISTMMMNNNKDLMESVNAHVNNVTDRSNDLLVNKLDDTNTAILNLESKLRDETRDLEKRLTKDMNARHLDLEKRLEETKRKLEVVAKENSELRRNQEIISKKPATTTVVEEVMDNVNEAEVNQLPGSLRTNRP